MRLRAGLVAALVLSAGTGLARAPEVSLRPVARAGSEMAPSVQAAPLAAPQSAPSQAPSQPQSQPAAPETTKKTTKKRFGLFRSLRPNARGRQVEATGRKARQLAKKGAVCGDLAIQGEPVGRVAGKLKGCGVSDAVRVRSISGVALSTASVMDCGTARALKSWVDRGMKPAVGGIGGGVRSIRVAAHYACRTRNNQRGAKISEHGKGRAIDISGFTLVNGTQISVLRDWGRGREGRALRKMHGAACGPFGTVLGPNANKYHRDHFHFDTARYRSGSYCR